MSNRLDNFNYEEIQSMYLGAHSGFRGTTELNVSDADKIINDFYKELTLEMKKRQNAIEAEIERITPRCKCCNQRVET